MKIMGKRALALVLAMALLISCTISGLVLPVAAESTTAPMQNLFPDGDFESGTVDFGFQIADGAGVGGSKALVIPPNTSNKKMKAVTLHQALVPGVPYVLRYKVKSLYHSVYWTDSENMGINASLPTTKYSTAQGEFIQVQYMFTPKNEADRFAEFGLYNTSSDENAYLDEFELYEYQPGMNLFPDNEDCAALPVTSLASEKDGAFVNYPGGIFAGFVAGGITVTDAKDGDNNVIKFAGLSETNPTFSILRLANVCFNRKEVFDTTRDIIISFRYKGVDNENATAWLASANSTVSKMVHDPVTSLPDENGWRTHTARLDLLKADLGGVVHLYFKGASEILIDDVYVSQSTNVQLSDLTWTPNDMQLKTNAEMQFSVKVTNNCVHELPEFVDVTVDFVANKGETPVKLGTVQHKGGLEAGESVVLTLPQKWKAPAGEWVVSAHATTTYGKIEKIATQGHFRVADTALQAPVEALAGGFDTLAFSDEFDIANVDTEYTGDYGYKWYLTDLTGICGDKDDYSIKDGVMTLAGDNMRYNWLMATMDGYTGAGWHGFQYGYLEYRTRFDSVPEGFEGTDYSKIKEEGVPNAPAIWSFPPEVIAPAAVGRTNRHVEMDWMEYWGYDNNNCQWTITMHDQISDNTGKTTNSINNRGSNHILDPKNNIGDGEWHTVGYRWEKGLLIAYLDGREIFYQDWSDNGHHPTGIAAEGEMLDDAFTPLDNQLSPLILAGSKGWPLEIDYIRVWQKNEDKPYEYPATDNQTEVTQLHWAPNVSAAMSLMGDSTICWHSSNPTVASVANGVISTHREGEVVITAYTATKAVAQYVVTVDCYGERLPVGDFEVAANDSHKTWYHTDSAYRLVADGKGSIVTESDGNRAMTMPAGKSGTLFSLNLEKGKTYRFSGRVKGDANVELLQLYAVQLYDSASTSGTKKPVPTGKAGEWVNFSYTFTTTNVAEGNFTVSPGYTIYLKNRGTSAAYFDDLSLVETDGFVVQSIGNTFQVTTSTQNSIFYTCFGPSLNAGDYTITLRSQNTSILANTSSTTLTAKAFGSADVVVTATPTQSGLETLTKTVKVTVLDNRTLTLSSNALQMMEGDSHTLQTTLIPAGGTVGTTTFVSSNTAVATVDQNGKVTAQKPGVATITVTTQTGLLATCRVSVVKRPTVDITQSTATLEEGKTVTLSAVADPVDTTITWTSSDNTVATVKNGVVTALIPGTVTITATVEGGNTDTCTVTVTEKPKVNIIETTAAVVEGKTITLSATAAPVGIVVEWTSSDSTIATVKDGVVTGVKEGTVTITAKVAEGVTDTCTVTVTARPMINITQTTATVREGKTVTLNAVTTPVGMTITWISSDNTIATVKNGVVTGVKTGTVTITAKVDDDVIDTCQVTVTERPTVNVVEEEISLFPDRTQILTAVVKPTGSEFTWESSDNTIATVDQDGKVTAIAPGTVTITAKVDEEIADTCTVIVLPNIMVDITQTTAKVWKGETLTLDYAVTLNGAQIEWTSSDNTIATVDQDGKVTAIKEGTVTITATTLSGHSDTCEVTVATKPTVNITENIATVKEGKTVTLNATATPSDKVIEWISSDNTIATVENGVVTAIKAGTVTITATVEGGNTDTCTVTVTEKPTIDIIPTTASVKEGKTIILNATVTPAGQAVEWVSFDNTIATVKDGVVTGVSEGEVTIFASVAEGVMDTCTVYVTPVQQDKDKNLFPGGDFDDAFSAAVTYKEGITINPTAGVDGTPALEVAPGTGWAKSNMSITLDAPLKAGKKYILRVKSKGGSDEKFYIYADHASTYGNFTTTQSLRSNTEWTELQTVIVPTVDMTQIKQFYIYNSSTEPGYFDDFRIYEYVPGMNFYPDEWESTTAQPYMYSSTINSNIFASFANNVYEKESEDSSNYVQKFDAATYIYLKFGNMTKFAGGIIQVDQPFVFSFKYKGEDGTAKATISAASGRGGSVLSSNSGSADADGWKTFTAVLSFSKLDTNWQWTMNFTGATTIMVDDIFLGEEVVEIPNIDIAKDTATVKEGKTVTLNATVTPADKVIEWTSSDNTIATVANGVVTGVKAGVATITATTDDGISDTCSVIVTEKTAMDIVEEEISLFPEGTQLLTTTTADGIEITWESSDNTIATVDENGKVTAVAPGTVTITAKVDEEIADTCTVIVLPNIMVDITQTTAKVWKGETLTLDYAVTLNGAQIEWTSSDNTIATVDQDGKVTAIKEGTVTITATTLSGHFDTCEVTVATKPTVNITEDTATVEEGKTVTLNATATPADTVIEWISSDNTIATVENGVVTAIKAGTVTITAKGTEGITDTCTVTVTEKEFAGGSGTENDPYLVATQEHLNNVRKYLDAHFKLTADITLSGYWTPIGKFTGTFDGNGHVVKNLHINITGSNSTVYSGLFGEVVGGTIQNLGMVDSKISIVAEGEFAYVGGIAGLVINGTISNCYNTGNISVLTDSHVGGIAGQLQGATVTQCYNTGDILPPGYESYTNGGIAGSAVDGSTISNCYNAGKISADFVGGIVGSVDDESAVANCYNIGLLSTFFKPSLRGGIVGSGNSSSDITNCYYLDIDLIGAECGGTEKATRCSLEEMQQIATFAGFDFDTVWCLDATAEYPLPTLREVLHIDNTTQNNTEFAGGSGQAYDPYLVATKEHLNNVRKCLDAHFKLTADIEFTDADFAQGGAFYNDGAGWLPIGDDTTPFIGTFDGDGHVIKKLYINTSGEGHDGIGLFGNTKYATVKNLGMVEGCITTTSGSAGSIAGYMFGGFVTNCYNTGAVSSPCAGGIVGAVDAGSVTKSYNTGAISSSGVAGGIVGRVSEMMAEKATLMNCYNTGAITVLSQGSSAVVGGIVGTVFFEVNVTNCYNVGTVTLSSNDETAGYAGSIVGEVAGGPITNCYYLEGTGSGEGVACSKDQMKQQATFVGFDFESVWTMDGNEDYPFPELRGMTHSGTFDDKEPIINIIETEISLFLNGEQTLTATVTPEDSAITWTSSDNTIATVDENGKVTAVAPGTVTITAKVDEEIADTCTVIVLPNIMVDITQTTAKVWKGETLTLDYAVTLNGAQIEWTSSDNTIATVDQDGKVTAIKEGTVTITATTLSGHSDTCEVTVATKPTVDITENIATVKEGKTVTLNATATPADTVIEWISSDNTIATVENGVVTAIKAGTVTITAKVADGITDTCTVIVTEAVSVPTTYNSLFPNGDLESELVGTSWESANATVNATAGFGGGKAWELTARGYRPLLGVTLKETLKPDKWYIFRVKQTGGAGLLYFSDAKYSNLVAGTVTTTSANNWNEISALFQVTEQTTTLPTIYFYNENTDGSSVYYDDFAVYEVAAGVNLMPGGDGATFPITGNGKTTSLLGQFSNVTVVDGAWQFGDLSAAGTSNRLLLSGLKKMLVADDEVTVSFRYKGEGAVAKVKTSSDAKAVVSNENTTEADANGFKTYTATVKFPSIDLDWALELTFSGATTVLVDDFSITSEVPLEPEVDITNESETVQVGNTVTLSAKTVPAGTAITWTSSDDTVATVQNGVVTAHKAGTVIITAKIADGITDMCAVTVIDEPLSVFGQNLLTDGDLEGDAWDNVIDNNLVLGEGFNGSRAFVRANSSAGAVLPKAFTLREQLQEGKYYIFRMKVRGGAAKAWSTNYGSMGPITGSIIDPENEWQSMQVVFTPAESELNKDTFSGGWYYYNSRTDAATSAVYYDDFELYEYQPGINLLNSAVANGEALPSCIWQSYKDYMELDTIDGNSVIKLNAGHITSYTGFSLRAYEKIIKKNVPYVFSFRAKTEGDYSKITYYLVDSAKQNKLTRTDDPNNPGWKIITLNFTLNDSYSFSAPFAAYMCGQDTWIDDIVLREAATLDIEEEDINLIPEGTVTLTANLSAHSELVWESSDETVAIVHQNGKVTAIRAGTATITATTKDGYADTCTVTVFANVQIDISQNAVALWEGETLTLGYTLAPTGAILTWTSSDDTIASVDQNGKVTALKDGSVTITATTLGGIFDTCTVTVKKRPTVDIDENAITLEEEQALKLNTAVTPDDTAITWTSSDDTIATVENGVVTGVKPGVATITATVDGGNADTCEVTVVSRPKIDIYKAVATVCEGKTISLSYTVYPTDSVVTWKSSNETLATVDQNGVVTGVKSGVVTITATTQTGQTDTCTVMIVASSSSVDNLIVNGDFEDDQWANATRNMAEGEGFGGGRAVYIAGTQSNGVPGNFTLKKPLEEGKVYVFRVKVRGVAQLYSTNGYGTFNTTSNFANDNDWSSLEFLFSPAAVDVGTTTLKGSTLYLYNKKADNASQDSKVYFDDFEIMEYQKGMNLMSGGDGTLLPAVCGSGWNVFSYFTEDGATFSLVDDGTGNTAWKLTNLSSNNFSLKPLDDVLKQGSKMEISFRYKSTNDTPATLSLRLPTSEATLDNVKETIGDDGWQTVSATLSITASSISYNYLLGLTVSGSTEVLIDDFSISESLSDSVCITSKHVFVEEGETVTLTAKVTPYGKTVQWTSSDETVATVDQNGVVTAIKIGTVTITATIADGIFDTCVVYVTEITPDVDIIESGVVIYEGETVTLHANVKPAGLEIEWSSWSSDNENIATVDQNGVVTGIKHGMMVIEVRSKDYGLLDWCTVTVLARPAIDIVEETVTVQEGVTVTLHSTVSPDDTRVTWTSSDNTIATVADGKVTGVKPGVVTITATTEEGVTDTCQVTITESTVTTYNGLFPNGDMEGSLVGKYWIATNATVNENAGFGGGKAWEITYGSKMLSGVTLKETLKPDKWYIFRVKQSGGAGQLYFGADRKFVNLTSSTYKMTSANGAWNEVFALFQVSEECATLPTIYFYNQNYNHNDSVYYDDFEVQEYVDGMNLVPGGDGGALPITMGTVSNNVMGALEGNLSLATDGDNPVWKISGLDTWVSKYLRLNYLTKLLNDSDGLKISFRYKGTDASVNVMQMASNYAVISNESTVVDEATGWKTYSADVKFLTTNYAWGIGLNFRGAGEVLMDDFTIQSKSNPKVDVVEDAATILIDKTVKLNATVVPTNTAITWISSDETIATVDESGVVTGLKAGVATITAKVAEGITDICTVTVLAKPTVDISETAKEVTEGKTVTLSATATPSDKVIEWISSDNTIATVENGVVTALKAGVVTITAKVAEGVTDTCTITVLSKPKANITQETATLEEGQTLKLNATVDPIGTTVVWSSSDITIATVANGTVIGIKAGVVTITATAADGYADTCQVTVTMPTPPTYSGLFPNGDMEGSLVGKSWISANSTVNGTAGFGGGKAWELTARGYRPLLGVTLKEALEPGKWYVFRVKQSGGAGQLYFGGDSKFFNVTSPTYKITSANGAWNEVFALFQVSEECATLPTIYFYNQNTDGSSVYYDDFGVYEYAAGMNLVPGGDGGALPVTMGTAANSVMGALGSNLSLATDGDNPVWKFSGLGTWSAKYLRLSYLTKLLITSENVKISFRYKGTDDSVVRVMEMAPNNYPVVISNESTALDEATGWKTYSVNVEFLTKNNYNFAIGLLFQNADEVLIDDFSIVEEFRTSVDIAEAIATVEEGKTVMLNARVEPEDAVVTWTSSNESIATVDKNGVVMGIKPGNVTITATLSNGKSDSCLVRVNASVFNGKTTDDALWQCVITEKGAELVTYLGAETDVTIPNTVTVNGTAYNVWKLGDNLFNNNDSITNVTLCENLSEIGNRTFYDADALLTVVTNQALETIGSDAFSGCEKLNKITLYIGVGKIGQNAFDDCSALTIWCKEGSIAHAYAASNNIPYEWLEFDAQQDAVVLGGVTYHIIKGEAHAVAYDSTTKHVVIPAKVKGYPVTSIEEIFKANTNLVSVKIEATITAIPDGMFSGCSQLEKVELPDTLTAIPADAFSGCTKLTNVTIPKAVATIGANAFANSDKIQTVVIPGTVTSMQTNSFHKATILLVEEGSYAHTFARENDLLYFVIKGADNPEIRYGTEVDGTVIYLEGLAAGGVTVEILYADGTLKERVTADAEGRYEFTYAEVGQYTIRATDAFGNTASTEITIKRMNMFDVILTGDTVLTLKRAYRVAGQVNTGGATVTLLDQQGKALDSVLADEEGNFVFDEVANGTYVLLATTESGRVSQEITVYNGNVTDVALVIEATSTIVWGYVDVQDRNGDNHRREWVQVTAYNNQGVAVAQCKSDKDGKFTFYNLPFGEYSFVAETTEMRPDKKNGFDRNFVLTGYAYESVTEIGFYQVDIVLYEENNKQATISGKVTAHGETQKGEVILRDVFHHEIARYATKNNGKYTFTNVPDGLYFVTAITDSDGMGYAVVVVRDGKVHGTTDITIQKSDKIKQWEDKFNNEVPRLTNRDEAKAYKDRITDEKRFYDSLSEKEKKQLTKDYIERLNQYVEWLSNMEYTSTEGVTIQQGGLVVSGDELENDSDVHYTLNVEKTNGHNASKDGVNNRDDFIHHAIHDVAKDDMIKQYYEITLSKTVNGEQQQITNVQKDTNATGKFRIVLQIPEEDRGHKHYSVLHEHCGKVVQLADLDDNPDTITIEVDAFSTFVLTATDEFLTTEKLAFAGASLSLQHNLSINYKVDKALFEEVGYENPYVIFELNGVKTKLSNYTVSGDRYVFTFKNIAPNQMNDTVLATLYATHDGVEYASETREYSVAEYCYNMLGRYVTEDYAELQTLLVDLLHYGAASQIYTNYNVDALVNASLTKEQLLWGTSEDPALESSLDTAYKTVENPKATWKGAGLNLQDAVAVRLRFVTENAEGLTVRVESEGKVWNFPSSKFQKQDDEYQIFFTGLDAGQMRQKIYITIYEGETPVSNTACYSIETYAYKNQNNSVAGLGDLVKAMMKYGDSAYAYAH